MDYKVGLVRLKEGDGLPRRPRDTALLSCSSGSDPWKPEGKVLQAYLASLSDFYPLPVLMAGPVGTHGHWWILQRFRAHKPALCTNRTVILERFVLELRLSSCQATVFLESEQHRWVKVRCLGQESLLHPFLALHLHFLISLSFTFL